MYDVNGLQLEATTYMFLILLNAVVTGKGRLVRLTSVHVPFCCGENIS